MNTSVLTLDERSNIESGPWFAKLSPALREAILARSTVRRVADGAMLAMHTPTRSPKKRISGAIRCPMLAKCSGDI